MYIVDKKIMGVLVAEAITSGFRMLADSASSQGKCCSTEASPAVCGVSRIWTLASYRRHKVATRLVDAMRYSTFHLLSTFDSSVGRAVDCSGTQLIGIHRSLVQIRLEGNFFLPVFVFRMNILIEF